MNIFLDIGFRFLPPDEELVSFFLPKKMVGDHDHTCKIREVDLLQQEPWDLPAKSIVQSRYPEWVFFYKLIKKSKRQNDRLTHAGYWKSTGQDRDVFDGDRVIGSKKTLVFYKGRTPGGLKTDWVMHEFRVKPELIPPNADATYVVGILRNKSAERTETSTSNDIQPSSQYAESSSQNDAVAVSSAEGMSPSFPISGSTNNDQDMMEEEVISLDNNDTPLFQFDNNIIEQESDFLKKYVFAKQNECSNVEIVGPLHLICGATNSAESSDIDSEWAANVLVNRPPSYDQDVLMSDGIGISNGHMGGFNQRRMVNGSRQDEILMMSSVDLGTFTSHQINCVESAREEISVNSRTCRSQYDPIPHSSVVQAHPSRVQLQSTSSKEAVLSRHKAREGGVHGPVVEHVQNRKSILHSNKDPKMEQDRKTKRDVKSRSKWSVGISCKIFFNFLEMSQRSCKSNSSLVCLGNVIVGLFLLIFLFREVVVLV